MCVLLHAYICIVHLQGHNDLILALLNQQQQSSTQPLHTTPLEVPTAPHDSTSDVKPDTDAAHLTPEYEQSGLESTAEGQRDKEDPSSTSFGNLLKKGSAAYAQSPAELSVGLGARDKKPRAMSTAVMQSDVLPFYNAVASQSHTPTVLPTAVGTAPTGQPSSTSVIAGVLVGALQQLVQTQIQPTASSAHEANAGASNPKTNQSHAGMKEENMFHGTSGSPKDYLHEVPSEQRGQQFAPSSPWVKPLPSAWVNVSMPPSQADRARMQRSVTQSCSVDSWDEDAYSASSCSPSSSWRGDDHRDVGDQGLLLHDSRDRVVEREDPTLAMLRRDMVDSRQHRSALSHHPHSPHQQQNTLHADVFENTSLNESWDVAGGAMYSSDSSLGSYASLSAGNKATGRPATHTLRSPEVAGEEWFDGDEMGEDRQVPQRKPQRASLGDSAGAGAGAGDSLEGSSLELPTPLCSSILPCASTLHYANRSAPGRRKGRQRTRPDAFPTRDPPDRRMLQLAAQRGAARQGGREGREQRQERLSLSTYSSGDSAEHLPSFRQPPVPRPTLSDYEPSTTSTSTNSSRSLGSVHYPRPSCMLRNKFEKKQNSDDSSLTSDQEEGGHHVSQKPPAGKDNTRRGVHNHFLDQDSLDSEDSAIARYARFIADDSSSALDDSSGHGGRPAGIRSADSSMSDSSHSTDRSGSGSGSGSDSVDTYSSSVSGMSSTSEAEAAGRRGRGGGTDLTLPRSLLKLWRPTNKKHGGGTSSSKNRHNDDRI